MAGVSRPPVPNWTPPSAPECKAILDSARTVAMVGVSSNPARPSHFVATYLCSSSAHYDLYFVNPREREILGRPVYATLRALPVAPDIVDVFRRPADIPAIAREAVDVGAQVLWLQLGLWSAEAAELAANAGLGVVMDRCLKIEHARFHGGLHLAGFDTGVIDSRRRVP